MKTSTVADLAAPESLLKTHTWCVYRLNRVITSNRKAANGFSKNTIFAVAFKFSLLLLSHYESKLELVFTYIYVSNYTIYILCLVL